MVKSNLEDPASLPDETILMLHAAIRYGGYVLESKELTIWIQEGRYLPGSIITKDTIIKHKNSERPATIEEFVKINHFYKGLSACLINGEKTTPSFHELTDNILSGTANAEYEYGKIIGEAFYKEFHKKLDEFSNLRSQRRRRILF